jgi:hypothetical protein
MERWEQLAQAIYYTGVGMVLLGTGIRFLYKFFHNYDQNNDFIDELREVYLSNIYEALGVIAAKLDVVLPPPPSVKPSKRSEIGHYKIGH